MGEELVIASSGIWRTTKLYKEVEEEVLGPLYKCRYGEAYSKKIGPPDYVYQDLRHRIRHVRRQVDKLHGLYFVKRIFNSIEIELLEYLLNSKSGEIWFVPAHHRHSLIVNLIYKWWRKYYDLVFEPLETYYNICYRLLRIVYPFTYWGHDYHIDYALNDLEKYLKDIHSFNIFIEKIKRISQSDFTKREKEYWLLQLKNIAYNFWSIIKEFKVKRYIKDREKEITFYRLNLNVKKILKETMKNVEDTLDDTYQSNFKSEPRISVLTYYMPKR